MTATPSINFDKLDITKLVVKDLKRNTRGQGESGFVNSDQFPGTKIAFCIPEITTAYALKETVIEEELNGVKVKKAAGNYKLTFQLEENTPLFKWLTNMQTYWVNYVKTNEKKQWKKVGLAFEPLIKRSINKQTGEENPPTFSMKIKYDQTTKVFSSIFKDAETDKLINLTSENSARELPRGTYGNFMAIISKFWVSANKCGIILQIENAAVIRPEAGGDIPMAPMPVVVKKEKKPVKVPVEDDTDLDESDEPVQGGSSSVPEFTLEKDEINETEQAASSDDDLDKKPEAKTKSSVAKGKGKSKK